MRDMMLNALKSFYVGNINRHIANVEVYLRMTVGIGEHSDIQETIDKEIEKIAQFDDKLAMVIKYDAPLRIQFERGINAFRGKQYIRNVKGSKVIATVSPYNFNTMQHREWQRGYNFAYAKQLEKVKREETRRRSKEVHAV